METGRVTQPYIFSRQTMEEGLGRSLCHIPQAGPWAYSTSERLASYLSRIREMPQQVSNSSFLSTAQTAEDGLRSLVEKTLNCNKLNSELKLRTALWPDSSDNKIM